jgi:hypothetical protein
LKGKPDALKGEPDALKGKPERKKKPEGKPQAHYCACGCLALVH